MKKQLFYLMILCSILGNPVAKAQAQCGIAQLSITDSATTTALRGYIRSIISPRIRDILTVKKTAIVLLQETRHELADGKKVGAFNAAICDNNHFKYHKMVIKGYFQLDNILYLVTYSPFSCFQANNYDYDNPCLSKILSNHSLKEYNPPKRVKTIRKNVEVEIVELGDTLSEYSCTIIPNSKDREDYRLLIHL